MPATYGGDPAASTLDWIRFETTDTTSPFIFQNEEINSKLADCFGNKWQAAAALLLIWARNIGKNPSFTIGRFSENPAAAAMFLEEKAKELLAMPGAKQGKFGAYVGGISVADREAKIADTDRTQGAFSRGYMDNPDARWGR
jgi:hypothetical protein